MKPLELWTQIERLVESQRLDRERVALGAHGSVTSLENLRRAAHDIKLKVEHFRAITRPGAIGPDLIAEDNAHQLRWAKRRGKGKS